MNVLIACEYSSITRDAFRAKGHNAWSCDLLPSEGDPAFHYQGHIEDYLWMNWDLLIAHPVCTYLCNSGVHHLHKDIERWPLLFEGAAFFRKFSDETGHIPKVAIENPVPHKYAVALIGRNYDQLLQPWSHGTPEKKGICLWLKGLKPIHETDNVKVAMKQLPEKEQSKIHYASPGDDRSKIRSKSFPLVAKAFADQWG